MSTLVGDALSTPAASNPGAISSRDVCAIVVAYHPDAGFEKRIKAVLPQVRAMVVIDNTPVGVCARLLGGLRTIGQPLDIRENNANLGIAAALNQGLELALQMGFRWVLTLDQDSLCYPDMVSTLVSIAATCSLKPAVIGSNYYDCVNGRPYFRRNRPEDWQEQITVITSGCLLDAVFAKSIGGFRSDYFIDQVDHEFCLRVRIHGQRVVISRKPVMEHSVGDTNGVRIPLFARLPGHPPIRKYYIARNSITLISEYWRKEPAWCARRLMRLCLGLLLMSTCEKSRLVKVRAFMAGVADAVARQMGPCPRPWLR